MKLPLFRICAATLLVVGLSGCVVLPGHRGHNSHRGVDVRVALPVPHVVIRPGGYRHHDRDRRYDNDRYDDRYDDRRGRGRGPY